MIKFTCEMFTILLLSEEIKMLDSILGFIRDLLAKYEEFLASDILETIRLSFEKIFGAKGE